MIRLIIDTSTLIGLFLSKKPTHVNTIIQQAKKEELLMCISKDTLLELKNKLAESKIKSRLGKNQRYVARFVNFYQHKAEYWDITNIAVDKPIRDHTDIKFLKLALACEADYLLTGDNDLLVLGRIGKTTICKPGEFLQHTASR